MEDQKMSKKRFLMLNHPDIVNHFPSVNRETVGRSIGYQATPANPSPSVTWRARRLLPVYFSGSKMV